MRRFAPGHFPDRQRERSFGLCVCGHAEPNDRALLDHCYDPKEEPSVVTPKRRRCVRCKVEVWFSGALCVVCAASQYRRKEAA